MYHESVVRLITSTIRNPTNTSPSSDWNTLALGINPEFTIHMSRFVRKPAFCICENKDADQLRGNRTADQRLCFRYIDTTIPLLSKSEISSL